MAEHAHTTAAPAGAARSRVERAIERHLARAEALIAALDAADGDPDLEDSDEDQACEDEGHKDAPLYACADYHSPDLLAGLRVRQIARRLSCAEGAAR